MVVDDPIELDDLDLNHLKRNSNGTKLWNSSTSKIGIIGIYIEPIGTGWNYIIYYDIYISFPEMAKEWSIKRTYEDFIELHSQLLEIYHKKINQRHIVLPKPSRIEFHLSIQARYIHSAKRLREKLNLYLHQLLEIHEISCSSTFRHFFNQRDQDICKKETMKLISQVQDVPSGYDEKMNAKDITPLSSNDSACSTATTDTSSELTSTASETKPFARRGSDWQLETSLNVSDNISSANHSMDEVVTLQTVHQSRKPADILPPKSLVIKVTSNCSSLVLYGSTMSLRTCGGLRLGLTKRSAWSGSQKVAAVAAGGAGIVLLSGPVGLTIAAIGSLTKHHFSKTYSLFISPRETVKHDQFLIESASTLSGAGRAVHYGEPIRLLNVSKHSYLKVAMPVDSKRGYVSLTSNAQTGSLFRWISPLGYIGPIVCGSPACLQVIDPDTPWCDDLLSVHKDYITTDGSPGVFQLVIHNHPCLANEDMSRTVARPLPKSVVVRIMTYNVWFLPPVASILNLSPLKSQRAHAIPSLLPSNLDLIVFCEVFDAGSKIVLTTEMKKMGYLYETRNAGSKNKLKPFNSGIFIMSKYPLEQVDELLYGSYSVGDDKIADKGAIYVQMKKNGEIIHIIGTHMQAWDNNPAILCRENQLDILSKWIKNKNIPKRDALIIAGDFNIDMYMKKSNEYNWMLNVLDVTNPNFIKNTPKYSFNPFTNILASKGKSSGGKVEHLDYVMYSNQYRQPNKSTTQVIPLKITNGWEEKSLYDDIVYDLSDHYPVMSEFYFN